MNADWQDLAACRGMGSAERHIFFPGRASSDGAAKAVCARCPVRRDCLTVALETREHDGIWGGMGERERRKLRGQISRGIVPVIDGEPLQVTLRRKQINEPTRVPARCGTEAGFNRHRRLAESPCPMCMSAKAEANRRRLADRKVLRKAEGRVA